MDVAKVNLNTSAYDIPGTRAIHPSELLYNNKVQLIYRAK
ncbi:cell wall hydrolase [Lactococcus petauri]